MYQSLPFGKQSGKKKKKATKGYPSETIDVGKKSQDILGGGSIVNKDISKVP